MNSRRAVVTGANGQDGNLMIKYLLQNTKLEIVGTVRRTSQPFENPFKGESRVKIAYCDLLDSHSVTELIKNKKPDYFINFAGLSFVPDSFNVPEQTIEVNSIGVIHILEAIRQFAKDCHFFNASSSEIYGNSKEDIQTIDTTSSPSSIYGVSKNAAKELTKVYRDTYGLYSVTGVLFNHESPFRTKNYVSRKITSEVARIKKEVDRGSKISYMEIGNVNAQKDWSHSKDFMDGIWRMLNQKKFAAETFREKYHGFCDMRFSDSWKPSDYILASGETHSVREFISEAFEVADLELNYWTGSDLTETLSLYHIRRAIPVVKISQKFYRPYQNPLKGDSTPIREQLGWKPKVSFSDLVREMVENDIRLLN